MTSSSPRQLEPGTIVSEHFEPFEVNCILIGDPASVQSLFDALAEIGVPRPTPSTSDVGCSCCTVNLPDHDPKGMWSTSSGPGVTLRLQTRAAGSSYGKECAVLPPARPEDAPNKRGARSVVVVAMVRSPDIRLPDDVAEDLRTVYGAGFSDNRNLLLVDCGICYGRKMKSAALGMALEVYAYKLMQWSTEHNLASLELLISLILETARVPGYVPRIDYNGMAPEFGTALDITEMTPSAVQGVLQYLSTDTSGAGSIANVALRRWVQVKNWPAVTELILAQAVGDKTVNLSQLSLEAVPEQLTGITCRKLDLRGNSITHLPQWLLHADVDTILLGYECIPPPLRGKSWNVVKHCMLFGEEPTFPNSHKLIIIGDNTILQAEFLKCLMDNRHKFKMKNTLKSCAPPVISTHLPFKTSKKSLRTWTAWNLSVSLFPLMFSNTSFLP
ncbi:hypothetical protein Pelo_10350 [Pelomyxa schiedti]|nr:hypothetical protein Pelo_10350 [Pelomyxa schiedti]